MKQATSSHTSGYEPITAPVAHPEYIYRCPVVCLGENLARINVCNTACPRYVISDVSPCSKDFFTFNTVDGENILFYEQKIILMDSVIIREYNYEG